MIRPRNHRADAGPMSLVKKGRGPASEAGVGAMVGGEGRGRDQSNGRSAAGSAKFVMATSPWGNSATMLSFPPNAST